MQAIDSRTKPRRRPGDNAPRPSSSGQYIRSVLQDFAELKARGWTRIAGDRLGRRRAVNRASSQPGDGLPAESVLRCALLKQYRQLSYQELAFHLSDSASFRAFARLPLHWCPKKSVLQETISGSAPGPGSGSIAVYWQRQRDQGRDRHAAHRDRASRAERQLALVRRHADHAPVGRRRRSAAGPAIAWHNHSRREAACPGHRSLPQADQADDAVSRPDRRRGSTVGYLRAAAARVSAAACPASRSRPGLPRWALGSPWSSRLSSRPSGASSRVKRCRRLETGQPVRAAQRHHRQGRPRRALRGPRARAG